MKVYILFQDFCEFNIAENGTTEKDEWSHTLGVYRTPEAAMKVGEHAAQVNQGNLGKWTGNESDGWRAPVRDVPDTPTTVKIEGYRIKSSTLEEE